MNSNAIIAILIRGVKEILREPEVIFWIIIFPMLYLSISTIWIKPPSLVTLNVGVVYNDTTINDYQFNASTIVQIMNETVINETKLFNIKVYYDESMGIEAIRSGRIDACIVFPDKFSRNLTLGFPAKLKVYLGTGDIQKMQITEGIIKGFLGGFSDELAVRRALIPIKFISAFGNYTFTPQYNFTLPSNVSFQPEVFKYWILGLAKPLNITYSKVAPKIGRWGWGEAMGWMTLSMIGIMFLFAGMLSSAISIAIERERGTLRRMLVAPISPWDVLFGFTLVILFEQLISIIAVTLYGVFVMHAKIIWNPIANPSHIFVPILLLLAGLFSIGVGLIISMFTRTAKAATIVSQAIAWPLMFLSGLTLPKAMLPPIFRSFANIFPLTIVIDVIRDIVVYGRGIDIILNVLPYLSALCIIVYILGAIAYKKIVEEILV